MARPVLSVVVLCYRSGEKARGFARSVQETLAANGLADHQLVLVGNYLEGDDDPTPEVVRALAAADPRIVCSTLPKRGMMGWDMRTGMALATGEVIAVIDGDGQVKAGDLVRLYRALLDGGFDLALSRRVRRADGLARRALSATYNLAFGLLFPGLGAHDVNAKPKLLRRQAFERLQLTADDWFIDAELMIQARRLGFRICELPTEFLGLGGRRSFVSARAVVEFLRNLLLYRWREPRRARSRRE
jgi:glycosyltransferase involved in cell wall biosynthesis